MKGKLSPKLGKAWNWTRGFVSRNRAWAWRAGIGASIALIVLLIHRSAYSLVQAQPQYRLRPEARIEVAPTWGQGECTVTMPVELSLLDDATVERIGRLFEQNPWVLRVTGVERAYPDSLRVKFQARRPHIAIRRPEGVYLVDSEGVRLPGTYPSAPACERPIEIVGVTSTPPPPGRKWQNPEIVAGVELAGLAMSAPTLRSLNIKAVDVSNVEGRADRRRPETAFVTAQGCVIAWGRSPSSRRFGEPTSAEKLALLADVLREYPGLDGLKVVKVHAGTRAAVTPAEVRLGQRTPR